MISNFLNIELPVQSFFLLLHWNWRKKNSGMVSLLRGSCKLPNNSGLLVLWLLFANSLQNSLFVSLLEAYWESLSSEKPFLLTDVHLENPELLKVLFELIPMDLFLRSRWKAVENNCPLPVRQCCRDLPLMGCCWW